MATQRELEELRALVNFTKAIANWANTTAERMQETDFERDFPQTVFPQAVSRWVREIGERVK